MSEEKVSSRPKGSGVFAIIAGVFFIGLAVPLSNGVNFLSSLSREQLLLWWLLISGILIFYWGVSRLLDISNWFKVGQETITFVFVAVGIAFAILSLSQTTPPSVANVHATAPVSDASK